MLNDTCTEQNHTPLFELCVAQTVHWRTHQYCSMCHTLNWLGVRLARRLTFVLSSVPSPWQRSELPSSCPSPPGDFCDLLVCEGVREWGSEYEGMRVWCDNVRGWVRGMRVCDGVRVDVCVWCTCTRSVWCCESLPEATSVNTVCACSLIWTSLSYFLLNTVTTYQTSDQFHTLWDPSASEIEQKNIN